MERWRRTVERGPIASLRSLLRSLSQHNIHTSSPNHSSPLYRNTNHIVLSVTTHYHIGTLNSPQQISTNCTPPPSQTNQSQLIVTSRPISVEDPIVVPAHLHLPPPHSYYRLQIAVLVICNVCALYTHAA